GITNQLSSGESVSYLKRQKRAQKCMGCVLHKKQARVSKPTAKIIESVSLLKSILKSDTENKHGVCGACGCGLQSKVRFGVRSVLAGLTPEQIDLVLSAYKDKAFSACWMLGESLETTETKLIIEQKMKHVSPNNNAFLKAYLINKIQ